MAVVGWRPKSFQIWPSIVGIGRVTRQSTIEKKFASDPARVHHPEQRKLGNPQHAPIREVTIPLNLCQAWFRPPFPNPLCWRPET